MKKLAVLFFCLFIFCLSFTDSIFAETHYRYIRDPKIAVYFGHISYTETRLDGKDPVVFREGNTVPEVAVLNFPIAPGDTVITPGDRRCEIQFDTGTIIRLDTNTEVKVQTILAQSLTSNSKLTNFVLIRGQIYVMYKQYSSSEILQILFSNASAKFKHKTVMMMRANTDGSTNVKVDTGQASLLYGPDEQHLEKIDLKKSQEATISVQNQILYTKYEGSVDFSLWNQEMNKNFLALHEGMSNLPKPIQRLSPAVFNFAQKFSNMYGDWQWNDIYGYVWRPFTNDRYPSGNWQPYYFGQWRNINGDLFWVAEEKWGWVPYHLGVWVWDKKTGWLWIPGGAFAPSWASWNFYGGHFAWRPLTLFDWLFQGFVYFYSPSQVFDGLYAGGQINENIGSYTGSSIKKSTLNKINKNQLQKKKTVPAPLSKEMRKILANLRKAIKNGDASILASMKEMPKPTTVVHGDHLSSSSLGKWMMELDQMSALIQGGLMARNPAVDPLGYARIAYKRNDLIVNLAQNMIVAQPDSSGGNVTQGRLIQPSVWIFRETKDTTKRQQAAEGDGIGSLISQRGRLSDLTSGRFRDWNPDVKEASRLGVTIKYSSLENAVRIPELERTSSSGRRESFNFSRGGAKSFASTSSRESSSSSSSSSSGSSSSSSSSSSRSSKSSSTKSAGSKTIKKF